MIQSILMNFIWFSCKYNVQSCCITLCDVLAQVLHLNLSDYYYELSLIIRNGAFSIGCRQATVSKPNLTQEFCENTNKKITLKYFVHHNVMVAF